VRNLGLGGCYLGRIARIGREACSRLAWLFRSQRFFTAWERLRERGYDERFRRLWDFYLSSSEAGFRERRIGDVQALFAKPGAR
jgi:hypothetical protein